MRSKLLLPLSLLVVLIAVLLIGFGCYLAYSETKVVRVQYQELYLKKLQTIDRSVSKLLEGYKLHLLMLISQAESEASRTLGADHLILASARVSGEHSQQVAESSSALELSPKAIGDLLASEKEWVSYFDKNVLHVFFIAHSGSGTYLIKIDQAQLLADITSIIPGEENRPEEHSLLRGVLINEHGETVYTWGRSFSSAEYDTLLVYSLSPPLQALTLKYQIPLLFLSSKLYSKALLSIIPTLIMLMAMLIVFSSLFYRAHEQELRESSARAMLASRVSHELRTPLTNIRLYAELLANRELDLKEKSYLQVIIDESSRLNRLINSVLTFSLKDRGQLKLNYVETSIPLLIEQALRPFLPAFQESGLEIKRDFSGEAQARVDADALTQILVNLFANVERHAVGASLIEITYSSQQSKLIFSINDNGPGIEAAESERIFKAYERKQNGLAEKGLGLGLSISRELALLHGGALELLPSLKGACFRLEIENKAESLK